MATADRGIADLPPLRSVIAAHGLAARKSLGQHFLLDLNLTRRIAEAGGSLEGTTVIEVGPGPGGLTRAILGAGAGCVIAIEKDRRCRDALAPLAAAAQGRLRVIDADAVGIDEQTLLREWGANLRDVRIVSNLPYNVAAVLIIKWLRQIAVGGIRYRSLLLTLQKEVAARLTAKPRTKAYGRLSVMCQWLTSPASCFDIGPRAFTPPPKVTSSVIHLTTRDTPLGPANWGDMETVTRAAFGQRRKMLRSSLRSIAENGDPTPLLSESRLAPTLRAEEVDVTGYCALARARARLVAG